MKEEQTFTENIEKIFSNENNFSICEKYKSYTIIDNSQSNYDYTIAIPTYKRQTSLIEAIESAIRQTNTTNIKYEILVVDNDSEPNTEIEKLIQNKYVNQQDFRYIKNSANLQVFGNWNRCFELSKSKWVILLHDDDILHSTFIDTINKVLIHISDPDNLAIIKPTLISWYEKDERPNYKKHNTKKFKFKKVKAFDYPFLGNYFGAPTCCLFNKDIILKTGGFSKIIEPCGDIATILKLSMTYNVFLFKDVLGIQRIGTNETLNPKTLELFIRTRYYVSKYLIQHYHLKKVLNKHYMSAFMYSFYKNIRQWWNKDFHFDINNINEYRVSYLDMAYYKIIKNIYRIYFKICR